MRIRQLPIMVAVALLGWFALVTTPAGAHTPLLQGSPGPAQRVGGAVDFVDLAFLEPVEDAVVSVEFEGAVMAGRTTVSDGQIIRFEFDQPIASPGRYDVNYQMTSFDGDFTQEAYFFTYAVDAPEPARLGDTVVAPLTEGSSDGTNWVQLAALVVLIGSLVALLGLLVWWLDNRRRQSVVR